MIRTDTKFEYYCLNEATVDPDLARKHLSIINEDVVTHEGNKYSVLNYKQVLQSFDTRNWNGRIYTSKDTLHSLDNDPLVQNDIKVGEWNAEWGHPLIEKGMNELKRQMTIYPPNTCNSINSYHLEGNLLIGECTTLYGGHGETLKGRLICKQAVMASSRAIGGVDASGKVLPGYQVITFDSVYRASHKEAANRWDSMKTNVFTESVEAPIGNTMEECVSKIDIVNDPGFRDFVLTESRDRVERIFDTLHLDYNSLSMDGKFIKIKSIDESSTSTIFIPIKKVISMEYHNLF